MVFSLTTTPIGWRHHLRHLHTHLYHQFFRYNEVGNLPNRSLRKLFPANHSTANPRGVSELPILPARRSLDNLFLEHIVCPFYSLRVSLPSHKFERDGGAWYARTFKTKTPNQRKVEEPTNGNYQWKNQFNWILSTMLGCEHFLCKEEKYPLDALLARRI